VSNFGPDPRAFFTSVYEQAAPWDIGGAQPALADLFDAFPPQSPVLDVGCGSGDLAIALGQRGLQVLGVDFVDTAIAQARAKAAALPAATAGLLEFQVGDALRPSHLQRSFGSVVDCGFFHLFEPAPRDSFVAELAAILAPGGRYYLLAFSVDFPIPNVPRAVTADEVRVRFAEEQGWRILALREAQFLSRVAPVAAVAACIERLPGASAPRTAP
jgi:SAM-dependent methyltransferase